MTRLITKLHPCFTILAAVMSIGTVASADEYDHIDRLAVRIQGKARLLLEETVHYRHTLQYRRLVAETTLLLHTAAHIHDVTHFEGNLYHLERDLRDLDRCFHRLESLFDITEHDAVYGGGHVHGNTAHVKRLLDSIEDSIHHLQDDVRELKRCADDHPVYHEPFVRPVPVYGGGHGYYGQANYGRGIGFSIGGGSSRIQIRF